MESDVTPHPSVGSLSSRISSIVTSSGDRVADMDTKHIEKIVLVVAKGTKRNLRKWVVKKHGSQVGELD